MRRFEELLGRLSVGLYHGEKRLPLNGVSEVVDVDSVISCRMEDVDGIDRGFSALLEAEDQVDPSRKRRGHDIRLQRLTMDQSEQPRVA